jgi:hypothetical protein
MHELAKSFAARQLTPAKGRQVYLNTLAIYAVHTYLQWLNIDTDLDQSDSWQANTQVLFNATDLILPGIGRLECCAVLADATSVALTWDVHSDTVGYVAVQVDQQPDQAALLGFLPIDPVITTSSETPLTELRSLDDLILYLDWIESGKLNRVRQWLENTVELGWREPATRSVRSRATTGQLISRMKQVELEGQAIDLQIQVMTTKTQDLNVTVRLSVPQEDADACLPDGLQLLILDDAGATQRQKQANAASRWLEQKKVCKANERFGVAIRLGEATITENFIT